MPSGCTASTAMPAANSRPIPPTTTAPAHCVRERADPLRLGLRLRPTRRGATGPRGPRYGQRRTRTLGDGGNERAVGGGRPPRKHSPGRGIDGGRGDRGRGSHLGAGGWPGVAARDAGQPASHRGAVGRRRGVGAGRLRACAGSSDDAGRPRLASGDARQAPAYDGLAAAEVRRRPPRSPAPECVGATADGAMSASATVLHDRGRHDGLGALAAGGHGSPPAMRGSRRSAGRHQAFLASRAAISCGTTVNTSPTMPKSAMSKIGASPSY
jgi:hypothetical protein